MAIVKDKMIYHDENKKPMGYDIKSGRKLLKTDTLMNFTRQGQHKEGYARKKKTKKTQKVQYDDDDNHHDQSNEIGDSRVTLRVDFVESISFVISVRTHKLIYFQNRYTKKQEDLFQLVDYLHQQGLSYPKIADYLNEREYLTYSRKPYRKSNISSLILRNKQRKERIKLRNTVYPITIRNFVVKLLGNKYD